MHARLLICPLRASTPLLPVFENAKCLRLKAFILGRHISHLSLQRERAGVRVSSGCRRRRRSEKNASLKIERRVMLIKTDRAQMIPFCAKWLLLKCLHPNRVGDTFSWLLAGGGSARRGFVTDAMFVRFPVSSEFWHYW